ncbi:ribosome small subunit-dependent GTPase A [Maribacter arcticus]|uniref:Small ribosomal subunit biogenesis GTPase RsgA n=1 Tax=Maribacter arcticus TaxID=561365 RepID=A0A1T5E1T6_9FLAO|nr:ribosome small subunit-dependent GTPase A [Maribacter arcticus]SKB77895.1 ribosome biogenesis GTPase [Maribacter arcticus]|tara:strand:+ start:154 stop:1218 length:1065 start_codon:yes stop_codon:yes gene_type:complete
MTLEDLGYKAELGEYRKKHSLDCFEIGRVISEHKNSYIVKTKNNEYASELIGNLRFTADSETDLPAVGDWVAISEYDENKALIHSVYPRHSILERKAVGKLGQTQIIATNIDFALIIQSVNRDFNINRIERYLTICHSSKIEPIVVLSKIDLIGKSELEIILKNINKRIKGISIVAISNESHIGLDKIKSILTKGKTYCLLGSSGVGKSTLINNLVGEKLMITGEISESIDRGKHITTHRELLVTENGILIDNPGMREVGITNSTAGLEITFDEILKLSHKCKFNDCTHTNEKDCAILKAVENGEVDSESYLNFLKMEREKDFFESSVEERKAKDKNFGKMIKNFKKQRNLDKY